MSEPYVIFACTYFVGFIVLALTLWFSAERTKAAPPPPGEGSDGA